MKDIVVIPRKEYESLLAFKKAGEFKSSKTALKNLMRAEAELKVGKTLSYDALAQKLGFTGR